MSKRKTVIIHLGQCKDPPCKAAGEYSSMLDEDHVVLSEYGYSSVQI